MTPTPSVHDIARALRPLPARHAQHLTWRLVQGKSSAETAALLGISPVAASIHLVRALEGLAARLEGRKERLFSDTEESVWAERLERELQQPRQAPAAVQSALLPADLFGLARWLVDHAEGLEQAIREAQLAHEASPDRVRDDWVRRIAILALLALALFFYWRSEQRGDLLPPPSPPGQPSR